MGKLVQAKLIQCRVYKSLCVEIFFKDKRLCKKRQEDTLSSQFLTMKFTQGKFMIYSTITKNSKFKKTKTNKL